METAPSQTKRLVQTRQLLEIASYSPDDAAELEVNLPPTESYRFMGRYDGAAKDLYSDFYRQAVATGDTDLTALAKRAGILHGFHMITKILSYAPHAYNEYTEKHNKPRSSEELAEILRNSSGILRVFAGIDQRRNHTYEANFGLLDTAPIYESLPFVITEDETGQLIFTVSRTTEVQTKVELINRQREGDLDPLNGSQKCPALGRVLSTQWENAICMCSERPDLFDFDLRAR